MGAPFDHAVMLLAQHNRDGALGIVINHPAGEPPDRRSAQSDGFGLQRRNKRRADVSRRAGQSRNRLRGACTDYRRHDTIDIDGRVALTDAAEVLRDIGLGKGPAKSLVAFGYAGWAPSQLDDEIKNGAWVTVPEDPALVFDDDRTKVWADALALPKPAGK